jgi:hypothetical protein
VTVSALRLHPAWVDLLSVMRLGLALVVELMGLVLVQG